jgi:hypothetical protein
LPISIVVVWILGFGASALAWTRPEDTAQQIAKGLKVDSIPIALGLAATGLLAWTAGYLFLRLRLLQLALDTLRGWSLKRGNHASTRYSFKRISAIFCAGLAARLALLGIGRYSYITEDLQGSITESSPLASVLGLVALLAPIALIIAAFATLCEPNRRRWILVIVILCVEVMFGLLSGYRSAVLLRFLSVAILYVLARGRIPLVAVVLTVLAVGFLSPFTSAYRDEVRTIEGTQVTATEAIALVPRIAQSTAADLSFRSLVTAPSDFLTQRLRFIDEVAIVVQKTPNEIPYVSVSDSILEAGSVLIPRIVWKDKPVFNTGLDYARTYWNQPEFIVSSQSPSIVGEGYLRGGLIAMVLILGLLGGATAALNRALSPRRYLAAAPLFVVAWIQLTNFEGSLILIVAGLTQGLLAMAAVMRWTNTASDRSESAYSSESAH